jgi:hypothetical protein
MDNWNALIPWQRRTAKIPRKKRGVKDRRDPIFSKQLFFIASVFSSNYRSSGNSDVMAAMTVMTHSRRRKREGDDGFFNCRKLRSLLRKKDRR